MEQPFSAINALPLSLLNLAEWQETYWNWYNYLLPMKMHVLGVANN